MEPTITKYKNISGRKMDWEISFRILLFTLILLCISMYSAHATKYFTRVTSGNWGTAANWTVQFCNSPTPASSAPVAGDTVFICSGATITLAANAACACLNISGTLQLSTKNMTVSGITTITSTGLLDDNSNTGTNSFMDMVINNGGQFTNTGNSAFTINGNFQNDGTFSAGTGVFIFAGTSKTFSGASGVSIPSATINGTYTNNGTLTVNTALAGTGTLTQGTSTTLNIGGTSAITNLAATAGSNTVAYTSTTAAQTVKSTTYYYLTINNSGQTATLGAATIVNGDLNITSGTLALSNKNITVSGSAYVTGTLSASGGTQTFNDITINSGGALNNSGIVAFTINGNLQDNGTLTAGTGVFTFAGTSKTFSGAIAISIPSTTINGTYTNNGTLTVNTALAGSGTLTQGSNSTLNLGGTYTISSIIITASGNTVAYTNTTAGQTVTGSTYQNLTINKLGQTATLGGVITVNGNLTVSAGTLNDAGYQITGNAAGTLSMASGTTLTLGTAATATSFPANFIPANISLDAASTVNYNSNAAQTLAGATYGNLTLTATGAVTKTAAGNITANGTLTAGTNNTFNTGGFTISAANAAINGACNNTGTFTVTNALSGTGSFTQGANSTLNLGGTSTITTLTATANPNTVVYTGASGDQTVKAITYYHLTLDNSGHIATMSASITVNGNLIVSSGTLQYGNVAAYTFTIGGNVTVNSGAIFQSHQTNSGKVHSLKITGNLTNTGTIKLGFDANDYTGLTFQGTGTSKVTGSGAWSSLAYMTMNKSTINDTVQILSSGFGTALTSGADILTTPQVVHLNPPVIFTTGTFIYDIPDNLSNLIDAGGAGDPYFTIPANVRIQINQGTVDMATYNTVSTTSDLWLKGQLIINGGTVTVSKNTNTTTNAGFYYSNASPTPVFTMNGGTLNCYGAFTTMMSSSDCIIFNLTGGTLTVNMGSSATAYELFYISNNAGTTVNWTGGTIVIQNKSSYTSSYNNADFDIGGSVTGSFNVSGNATVQFGNTSTPFSQTMRFIAYSGVTYPNVVVFNPGSSKSVAVVPYNNSDFKFKSLTIQSGQTFDMRDVATSTTNHKLTITADNGSYSYYCDGSFQYRTSTVDFNANSDQNIGGASCSMYNVTIEGSGTKNLNHDTYCNGNLLISAATLACNNYSLVVNGNWTNNGVFAHGTGVVWFWGTTPQTIGGSSSNNFNDIVILNSTASVSLNSDIYLDNFISIGTSCTVNAGNHNISVGQNWINDGNFVPGTGTVIMYGNSIQAIGGNAISNFYNLTKNGSGFLDQQATITVANNLNISAGIYYTDTCQQTGTGNLIMSGGTLEYLRTAVTVPQLSGTYSLTGGLVEFYASGSQTIRGNVTYHDVLVGSTGIKSLGNNIIVGGNLTVNPGATLAGSTYNINLAGDWINYGTFTQGTGTLTMNGSGTQSIAGTTVTAFYNLDFENSCILRVNASSTGTLTTNATVNLNTKTLTLGTSAASPGTLVYTSGMLLKGTFTRWFSTSAIANGSVNGLFPMGDTLSDYRPFYVSYPGGVPTGGSVSINHTTIYGAIATSVADGANTILQRHNSYWTSACTGFTGVSGTPFNLQAGATGMGTVTNIIDLRLMLSNSIVGNSGTNSGTNGAPIVQRTGLTLTQLGNNFYIGTTNPGSSPLPIELLSFNAIAENQSVQINWATASEFNNEYFTVERSKDSEHFKALLKVKGAGNSNRLINYTASDTSPLNGVSYYRLKQTDFDGNIKYSGIADVNFTPEFAFHVFPNPSDGSLLYIQFVKQVKDQDIIVQIFDMNGNMVEQSHKFISGCLENNIMELELNNNLKQGVYVVNAVSGESSNKCRLVIR